MGYLTSAQKTWEFCFCKFHEHGNLIQCLEIYGLCDQGKETGSHCSLHQGRTPSSQRPRRGQKLSSSWVAGRSPERSALWSHLILSLPHLLQTFSSPHWASKNLNSYKSRGQHRPKQPAEKSGAIKITVISVQRNSFSHSHHITAVLRVVTGRSAWTFSQIQLPFSPPTSPLQKPRKKHLQ